ncbi:MAG TPA: flagellar protein [Bradyrhizobium sp.]|nr:flagellar protein [Bradyrhizobium sp.]
MSINSINYGASVLGQSVQYLNNQLTNLSTQLSTGVKSTNYAGMGVNEGFAIAARATLSNITAFGDTMTNVNTIISAANTALQSLSDIGGNIQSGASQTPQNLDDTGQTSAQESAASQLSAIIGILNTQVGDRYIFSGSAINTPAVASADSIMNGTGNLAGLKQVITERQQADLGTDGMGRLVLSQPSSTSVQVAEDTAGSPFGLKLNSVTSSLTGATVSGPSGSPAAISVDLGATNPNPGDQVSFTFNLPDGTTQTVSLTATDTSPPPAGSFTIGSTPADTASNLNSALNSSISTLANTSLVAASAIEAGDNFFNTDSIAIGGVASTATGPVSASTTLSGSGTNSLSSGFAAGDTITVNGSTIQFYNSSTTPPTTAGSAPNTTYVDLATATVSNLLGDIDKITGSSTPSTISGGVVTIHTDDASTLNITSSNPNALKALGFSTQPVTAIQPPLRVSGSPLGSATSLTSGASDTVQWYTGNSGPGSARASSSARIDTSETVDFGAQADEQAIRQQLQNIAVFAAFKTSPSDPNANAQINDLSQSIAANLTPPTGQQTIADMQTDFSNAQTEIQAATARQTQTQAMMQNLIASTEQVSTDQVASELLAVQNSLQASYQATSMLSQLSLVKYLPVGG